MCDMPYTFSMVIMITSYSCSIKLQVLLAHCSNNKSPYNKTALKSIENMIRIQFTESQWIKNEARFKIIHDFNRMLDLSENIIRNAKKLEFEELYEKRNELKIQIINWQKELSSDAIANLESKDVVTTNFFSFYEIQHIEIIVQQCKTEITFDHENKKCNYHHLQSLQTFLPNTIKKYEEEMSD